MGKEAAKYKLAVGLEYDSNSPNAPIVGAKGEKLMADELVRLAKRFGIPVVEKPELAKLLSKVDTDTQIPEAAFKAAALVLAQVEKGK